MHIEWVGPVRCGFASSPASCRNLATGASKAFTFDIRGGRQTADNP